MPKVRSRIGAEITLKVRLEIGTHREGAIWVASCPALDVLSQGKTKAEAVSSLREAVDLWFESCVRRGVLDKALTEAGFKRGSAGGSAPAPGSPATVHEPKRHIHSRHASPARRHVPRYINVAVPAYTLPGTAQTGAAR